MNQLAPEPILRAAMRVLFMAGCFTRNWTLKEEVPVKQINELWEAIHVIPQLVCHWHEGGEKELLMYFDEYKERWSTPNLRVIYEQVLKQDQPNN